MKGEWAQVPGPLCCAFSSAPMLLEGPDPSAVTVTGTADQLSFVEAGPASSGRKTDVNMPVQSRLGVVPISGLQHSCGFTDQWKQQNDALVLSDAWQCGCHCLGWSLLSWAKESPVVRRRCWERRSTTKVFV